MPRLLRFSVSRMGRMTWRGRPPGGSPGMIEAADLVNEAIAKTIAGVRPWRSETCSLFQHLAGTIAQEISHAANSMENHLTVVHPGTPDTDVSWPPDAADETPDPELVALWRSEQHKLLKYLNDIDSMIGRMAELMLLHDIWETRELCQRLEVTPAEVANLRKRMKRAIRAYLSEDQQ